jgi:subtilisin family serine protease
VLDAAAQGQPAIEDVADLAQATIEDQGFSVDSAVAVDDTTCVMEVALDASAGADEIDSAIDQLSSTPGATVVQPNYVYELLDDIEADDQGAECVTGTSAIDMLATTAAEDTNGVNDPLATDSQCWWLDAANFTDAWKIQQVNNAVTVAVIDSGLMVNHPDITANVLTKYAWDVSNVNDQHQLRTNEGYGGDIAQHGTHVTGIISAVANNSIGIAGGSYNANILPVRVIAADGSSHSSNLVAAYKYVLDKASTLNVRVINMSLGSTANADGTYPDVLNAIWGDYIMKNLIDQAKDAGIVTVCAGGNNGDKNGASTASSPKIYPGDYENCVSVMWLNSSGALDSRADDNACKDIAAPGVSIYSLQANTTGAAEYVNMSGSSMAAPMVSAAFALLFAADPAATVDEACNAIYNTATSISNKRANSGCHGALNVAAALTALTGKTAGSDTTGNGGSNNSGSGTTGNTGSDNTTTVTDTAVTATTKALLSNQVKKAAALSESDYTIASWKSSDIEAQLSAAQALLKKSDLTETECAAQTESLKTAMSKLKSAAANADKLYSDVKSTDWFASYVSCAYELGIMSGSAGKFSPNNNMTRAEAVTVIYRAVTGASANEPNGQVSTFSDVPAGEFYTSAVKWAVENGITTGISATKFAPNESITREQLATFIWRAAGKPAATDGGAAYFKCKDTNKVSSWAVAALKWTASVDVLSGSVESDGKYVNPTNNTKRCEAAKMLTQAYSYLKKSTKAGQ